MPVARLRPDGAVTPRDYCRDRTRRARSSFYLPLFFLSPDRRTAMYALYAFCREVDDIVDRDPPEETARVQLARWRDELTAAFAGRPQHPVAVELARVRPLFRLPTEPFFAIIDGMEMDLDRRRYPDLATLTLYCRRVAVAVGELAMAIFCHGRAGAPPDPEWAGRFAHHLGMAFQLTNILRDVAEDARMGRIYLPGDALHAAGVTETAILAGHWSPALGRVMADLAATAEDHYRQAEAMAGSLAERRILMPALVMSGIYRAQLQRLRDGGFRRIGDPPTLSLPARLWAVGRTWLQARRPGRQESGHAAPAPPPPSP